jgi:hypothetical protein
MSDSSPSQSIYSFSSLVDWQRGRGVQECIEAREAEFGRNRGDWTPALRVDRARSATADAWDEATANDEMQPATRLAPLRWRRGGALLLDVLRRCSVLDVADGRSSPEKVFNAAVQDVPPLLELA